MTVVESDARWTILLVETLSLAKFPSVQANTLSALNRTSISWRLTGITTSFLANLTVALNRSSPVNRAEIAKKPTARRRKGVAGSLAPGDVDHKSTSEALKK